MSLRWQLMYVYKPMHGYNLMQAIARVNRVFKDKEGGLIVDYVRHCISVEGGNEGIYETRSVKIW